MKDSRHPSLGLRYGMSYELPALPTRLPLLLHPDFAATAPRVADWLRPYLVDYFGDPGTAEKYLRQDLHRWGAWCVPHTHPARFFAQQVWMNCAALLDDAFSAPDLPSRDALADELCAALDGDPGVTSPLARMIRAGHDLLEPLCASLGERLIAAGKAVIRNNAEQAHVAEFDDLDTYLGPTRHVNTTGYWTPTLAEWALDIDLGDLTATDPELHRACLSVMDHWVLVNDLYSFPKEIEEGEKLNAVWILLARGIPLQQALDTIAARAMATEDRFVHSRQRVLAGPLGDRADVRLFVTELGHMISGNLRFHRETTRYHGAGWTAADDRAGAVDRERKTLHRLGTVHNPLPD
ncbi:terpene synthase family protein [Actinokineospora inagensis]|uniref:terpene synthase family protein n=1 Tax=Actinokineospora inagensis TaxID=103730 RepID=UPI0004263BEE|nr:terpene synthase family protein [Actinokineospora inagensis]